MQYLKEAIKNRIITAALNEFKEKGYLGASMRDIARNAGVAIGNVYRYFKNKDELFNSIMEPVYTEFISLVFSVGKVDDLVQNSHSVAATEITDTLIEVFRRHGTELLIMIDKSQGSKYANMKGELVRLADVRMKNELLPKFRENGVLIQDEFITYVIASTFIEGLFIILRNYTDEAKITYLVNQFLNLYFMDIVNRWK